MKRGCCIILFAGTIFFSVMGGRTLTEAGSISGNRYYLHTSTGGSNRLVIMFGGMDEELTHAYPMLNALVYKEVDNGFVWSAHIQEDEYRVEWPSEERAVVEILRHDKQEVEGRNPDDRIIVEF